MNGTSVACVLYIYTFTSRSKSTERVEVSFAMDGFPSPGFPSPGFPSPGFPIPVPAPPIAASALRLAALFARAPRPPRDDRRCAPPLSNPRVASAGTVGG